ncbi:MAG: ABC transporter transmembrane domain-containing protein [Candidatus Hodarchaeales archaeon]|jgi:ATP-binding cassette subfamily B protein
MAWHLMGSLSREGYDRQYSDKELLSRLKPYLLNHKRYLFLVILFSVLATIFSLVIPIFFALGFDELLLPNPNRDLIITASLLYLALLILEWLGAYYYRIHDRKMHANIAYDLRKELFTRVNNHDLSFFDKNKTGKIMARISSDTFEVSGVILTVTELASVILRASLILVLL